MTSSIMRESKTHWWVWLFLALLTGSIFYYYTSPFFQLIGADSGMFLVMGRAVVHGQIPYIDFFDQKGPLIYFFNALPQFFWDSPVSVWIFEVILLFISLLLLYQTGKLFLKNNYAVFLPLAYIAYLLLPLEGGNLTETYSNPWIILALYFTTKVFFSPEHKVKPLYGFFLGLGFTVTIFMRATNAAAIIGCTSTLVVYLLIKKQWLLLGKNAAAFIGGFSLLTIPVCAYFLYHNAFYDFIYGTFIHNFTYYVSGSIKDLFTNLPFMAFFSAFAFAGIAGGLLYCISKRRTLEERFFGGTILLCTCITGYAVCKSGNPFLHYLLIGAPVFAIGIAMIFNTVLPYFEKKKIQHKTIIKVCFIIIAVLYLSAGTLMIALNIRSKSRFEIYKEENITLAQNIPENDKNSVLVYTDADGIWYYVTGILPSYKYFTWQDWMAKANPEINSEMVEMFRINPPKWVVTKNSDTFGVENIRDIILNKYIFIEQNENYRLYQLIQ